MPARIQMTKRQAAKLTGEKPRSKYGAQRTKYNGVWYHSAAEAKYAFELNVLLGAGKIMGWRRQVPIDLHVDTGENAQGTRIGSYVADFVISEWDGGLRYVDVKGFDTPLSKWKRKHAEAEYGIKIEIVK